MTGLNRRLMTRKQFLRDAAKGALTMKCLTLAGAEEAWARAVAESSPAPPAQLTREPRYGVKPLLTPENLNRFYQAHWNKPEFDKLAAEAKSDLAAFLDRNFTLTREQMAYLQGRYKSERSQVESFIDGILQHTRQHVASKAAGSPGSFTPVGAMKCPEGTSPKCLRINLVSFEVEYCWCG
jgi:hypothetical protein